jgi:type II secretory pathway component PulM
MSDGSQLSRWRQWSLRERALIALGGVVVVVAAGWPLLWAPIQRDVDASPIAVARARAAAASARQAAAEIPGLERKAQAPRNVDVAGAVQAALAAQGLRDVATSVDAKAGRARLTFAAIDMATLATLVETLGRDEQLFVREALLAGRVEPGSVRAELTLARDVR